MPKKTNAIETLRKPREKIKIKKLPIKSWIRSLLNSSFFFIDLSLNANFLINKD